jgi:hypothetical protein
MDAYLNFAHRRVSVFSRNFPHEISGIFRFFWHLVRFEARPHTARPVRQVTYVLIFRVRHDAPRKSRFSRS